MIEQKNIFVDGDIKRAAIKILINITSILPKRQTPFYFMVGIFKGIAKLLLAILVTIPSTLLSRCQ